MSVSEPVCPSAAPVLFLAFNRPDLFGEVADALRAGGPREVFVAIDGPRPNHPDDTVACAKVRDIAENLDWATCLHLKAEKTNLGCGPAIAAAISWALETVPEIIIVEDDCLPDPSFLRFCDDLLARYRDDERVMQIAGTNWGASISRFAGYSYAFTSFAPIWGWATWRRAWQLYEYRLDSWPRLKKSRLAEGMAVTPRFRKMLERDWEIVRQGGGTWDHQWQYAVLRHHGLSVCPARNLVKNLGFRSDATQLKGPDQIFSSLPLEKLSFPLSHPPEVARSASVESVYETVYWQKLGWPFRMLRWLIRSAWMKRALKGFLRIFVSRPS